MPPQSSPPATRAWAYLQVGELRQLSRDRGQLVAVQPQPLEARQLGQLPRHGGQLVGVEPQLLCGDRARLFGAGGWIAWMTESPLPSLPTGRQCLHLLQATNPSLPLPRRLNPPTLTCSAVSCPISGGRLVSRFWYSDRRTHSDRRPSSGGMSGSSLLCRLRGGGAVAEVQWEAKKADAVYNKSPSRGAVAGQKYACSSHKSQPGGRVCPGGADAAHCDEVARRDPPQRLQVHQVAQLGRQVLQPVDVQRQADLRAVGSSIGGVVRGQCGKQAAGCLLGA